MPEVESVAPVIDLEAMLQPISEENPSGESLQYSGLYDEIREARRADLDVAQGQWQTQLKVADFRKVIELAVPALTNQTKDMQITAWLSEALTRQHGFVGLRDSMQLMSGLQENFWETCFPEIDEGDEEGRANAIEWMDKQAGQAALNTAITGGAGVSYAGWEESKRFDIPENIETLDFGDQERFNALKAQAETEKRTTGEIWRKAKAQTRRAYYETLSLTLEECWANYEALNRTLEEKFDRNQVPSMPVLKKSLEDVRAVVKRLLQEKREQEPDATDAAESGGESYGGDGGYDADGSESYSGGGASGGGSFSTGGAVRSRQEALKRLSEVADFFRKTEPHSPVSYLVQRAVKWGNMPLDNWLQEVIKDENVLGQLRETLGFGSYSSGGGGDSGSSSADSWDSSATSDSYSSETYSSETNESSDW